MKTAAKVFIIIGLVCSIIVLISVMLGGFLGEVRIFYTIYGIYSLFTSIACLLVISGGSKTACVICGIFYIPVMLIASIFMFCIPESQLY